MSHAIHRIRSSATRFLHASLAGLLLLSTAHGADLAGEPRYRIPLKTSLSENASLALQPDLVDFGEVAVSQTRLMKARLVNTGTTPVTVQGAVAASPFSAEAAACGVLPAGGACDVLVSYSPRYLGADTSALQVSSTAGQVTGTLVGNAVRLLTDIEVSTDLWYFGAWPLGQTSDHRQLVLHNKGTVPFEFGKLGLVTGDKDFELSSECGTVLAADAYCTVRATFTPTEDGLRLGAFRIQGKNGSLRDVNMVGYGGVTDFAGVRMSVPGAINFGEISVFEQTASRAVRMTNVGSEPLEVGAPFIDGQGGAAFSVASECPAVLQPWQSCEMTVTATVAGASRYEAVLRLPSNEPASPRAVPLYAEGVEPSDARIVAEPRVVRLKATELNQPTQATVQLTNSGPNPTTITGITATPGTMFQASTGCTGPLAVGQTCEVTVTYQPKFTDSVAGSLDVLTTSQARPVGITLLGELPTAVLRASPSPLRFQSSIAIGQVSGTETIRVSNVGTAPLMLKSISVLDEFLEATSTTFAQSNSCGQSIEPEGSCEVSVVARPAAEGPFRAALLLESSDIKQPEQIVWLTATGFQGVSDIRPSAAVLNFGPVPQGETLDYSLSLKNEGSLPGQVVAVGVSGADSDAFSLVNHCGDSLQSKQSCAVNVSFSPTDVRAYEAKVVATTMDGKFIEVDLKGAGSVPGESFPKLRLSEGSMLFGQTVVGRSSGGRELELFNDGDAPLRIVGVSTAGEQLEPTTEYAQHNACGTAIPAKSSCKITVAFQPATTGSRTGKLVLQSNVPDAEFVEVPLRGDGVAGSLEVSPWELRFDETPVGQTVEKTVWLYNQSNAPASIAGVGIAGEDSDFSQTNACGNPLSQGDRCSVTVTFAPSAEGPKTGTLTILAMDGTTLSVSLRGTSSGSGAGGAEPVEAVAVSPSILQFGLVPQRGTVSQAVTIRNSTKQTQILTSVSAMPDSGVVSAAPDCIGSLAPESSCSFVVAVRPIATGQQTGAVSLAFADAAHNQTLGVSFTGTSEPVAPAKIGVVPTSLDFGLVPRDTPATQVLTVTNLGDSSVSLQPIAISQKGTDVSVTSSCPSVLARGASCQAEVHYSGDTRGIAAASLTIAADAGPTLQVPVRGEGLQPKVVVTPGSLSFDDTGVLTVSTEQFIQIGNVGNMPLTVRGITAESGFSIASSTCGTQIAPGSSCQVGVRFAPTDAKAYQARVNVATDDSASPNWGVQVTGRGLGALLVPSETTLSFAKQSLGGFETKTLVITNQGAGVASFATPIVTGGDFSVQSSTCSGLMQPQGSCEAVVRFSPGAGGRLSSSLKFPYGESQELTVSLRGEGPDAVLELTSVSLDFGAQSLRETSSPMEAVVRNVGTVNAYVYGGEIQEEESPFSVGQACRFTQLAPGASCSLPVTFRPATSSAAVGQLVVNSGNSAGALSMELKGTGGVPTGRLDLTSLDFGAMYTGKTRTLETVLTNTSSTFSMVVDAVTGGNGQFSGKANCQMPIPPQGTCPIAITAKPSRGGSIAEALRVVTTGGEYALTGRIQSTLVSLASVTPEDGPLDGGTEVSIIGTGFGSDSRVFFGSVAASSVRVVSDTQLLARTPPGKAGKVTVQVVEGEAAPVSKVEGFTYLAAPSVTGMNPSKGGAIGGWEAVLSGRSLTCEMSVKVEGKSANVVSCVNGTLRVVVPARATNASGIVDVVVAHGGGTAALPGGLEYVRDAAALVLDSEMASIGNVLQGSSATRAVRLSNAGTLPTDVRTVEVLGQSGAGEYALTTVGATCAGTPFKLYAKQACLLAVKVGGMAGDVTARLVVNRGAEDEASVALSASFVQPDFAFSSTVKDYSEVASAFPPIAALSVVGKANNPGYRDMTVFFNNVGLVAGTKISNGRIVVSGPQAARFTVISINQVNSAAKVVRTGGAISTDRRTVTGVATSDGAGDSPHLQVVLRYTPTVAGTDVAQLRLDYDGENFALLPLVGSAVYDAAGYLSGASTSDTTPPTDYGQVAYNPSESAAQASQAKTIYVRNRSTAGALLQVTRLSIAGPDAKSFVIAGYGETLTGTGQDRSPTKMVQSATTTGMPFTVAFTPSRVGAYSAMLIVEHTGLNDQGVIAVPLTAVASRDVTLEPTGGLRGEALPAFVQADGSAESVNGVGVMKTLFLRNVGAIGKVSYKSVTIEGSPAFSLYRSTLVAAKTATMPNTGKTWSYVRYADLGPLIGEDASKAPDYGTDLGLMLSFKPQTEGEHVARVVIAHDGPGGETVVELRASAVNRAKVALRRADNQDIYGYTGLDFGVTDPSSNTPREIRVEYDGGMGYGAVKLEGVRLSGPDADQFAITQVTRYLRGSQYGYQSVIWTDTKGQSSVRLNQLLAVGYGTAKRDDAWGEITLIHRPTRAGTHKVDVTVLSSSVNKEDSGTVTARVSFVADLKVAGGSTRLSNENFSAQLSRQTGQYVDGSAYAGFLPGPRAGKHYLELRMDETYAASYREAQVDFLFNWKTVYGSASGAVSFNAVASKVTGNYIVAGTDGPFERPTFKAGDRFGLAYDADNGVFTWYFYEQALGACRLLGETRLTVKGIAAAPKIRAYTMASSINISITNGATGDYACPLPEGYTPWPNR